MGTQKQYYPQLDGLRALAAVGVLHHHWLPELSNGQFHFDFGEFGVQLFFVLSGFLITLNLIRAVQKLGFNASNAIKNFIIRRALRLFPIYYLFLGFLVVMKQQYTIDHIGWYLGYASNIHMYMISDLPNAWANHTWTLAVEEQFYVVYPWLILLLSKRKWLLSICLLIISGLIARFFWIHFLGQSLFGLLTPGNFHLLGIGGLLAYGVTQGVFETKTTFQILLKNGQLLSLFLLVVSLATLHYFGEDIMVTIVAPVFFGLLIIKGYFGYGGWFGTLLANRHIRYIGKISYGIYLYHKVFPYLTPIIFYKLNISLPDNFWFQYLFNLIGVFVTAHFSWILIEKRFLTLKDRFIY